MQSIVIVGNNMLPGGSERVICNLANYISNSGIKVTIILMKESEIYYSFNKEIALFFIKDRSNNHYINKIFKYSQFRTLVNKINPDIVLSMPEEIGIYSLAAMLGSRVPVVVSERNNPWIMPYNKITRILRRLLYPFASGLIFQTTGAEAFFSKNIRHKSIVLPNPIDISSLPDIHRGERKKTVLAVGRFFEQKNFRLLIEAFAMFQSKHSEYSLKIYGEGHLRQELESLATSLLLKGTWDMPGRSTEWLKESKDCAMFVLSSDFEGMPNALIEAMAVGIPSISTDCPSGGSAALIKDGINGLLVPVANKQALCEAMCRIAEDSNLSRKISDNGTKIRESLSSEIVCEKWVNFLEEKTIKNAKI